MHVCVHIAVCVCVHVCVHIAVCMHVCVCTCVVCVSCRCGQGDHHLLVFYPNTFVAAVVDFDEGVTHEIIWGRGVAMCVTVSWGLGQWPATCKIQCGK